MIEHCQPNRLHGVAEIGQEINRVIDAVNNLAVGKKLKSKPAPAKQSAATKKALVEIQENLANLQTTVASLAEPDVSRFADEGLDPKDSEPTGDQDQE